MHCFQTCLQTPQIPPIRSVSPLPVNNGSWKGRRVLPQSTQFPQDTHLWRPRAVWLATSCHGDHGWGGEPHPTPRWCA